MQGATQTEAPLEEAESDWLGSADHSIYSDGAYELDDDIYADYLSGTWGSGD